MARSTDSLDDVIILQFLEQTDLSNSGARHALVFCFEPDLLQSDDLIVAGVACFVDDPVCP